MALTIIHLCEGFPVRLNCLECKLFKISFSRINYRKMITSYIYNSVTYNYTFSCKNMIKIVGSTFTSTTKSRKCSKSIEWVLYKWCCELRSGRYQVLSLLVRSLPATVWSLPWRSPIATTGNYHSKKPHRFKEEKF